MPIDGLLRLVNNCSKDATTAIGIMSELQPRVLEDLPEYRPVELGFCYANRLQRDLDASRDIRLNDRARQYVDAELSAARVFTSLALRAGVATEEDATVMPLWPSEELLSREHCLERRIVTYRPLPLPRTPGRFAVLQQVHYLLPYRGGRRMRCVLPVAEVFQHDMSPVSPPQLVGRYVRPDLQFLDAWIEGVRGTPFFASCSREHLVFREIMGRRTPEDRERFDRKVGWQKQYTALLGQLAERRLRSIESLPVHSLQPDWPDGASLN